MFTLAIVLAIAAYSYLKKFDPLVIIVASSGIVLFWTLLFIRRKYLETTINTTDEKLQKKLLSSENDAK